MNFHFLMTLLSLRVRIQMMNCPTLPVASRNLGHPGEVRQNPKLSGIWAAVKMCQNGALGVPQKRQSSYGPSH